MFKQVALQIPVTLHVCGCGLVISLVDMLKVFEIPTNLKEMHHISEIREVSRRERGKEGGRERGGREEGKERGSLKRAD